MDWRCCIKDFVDAKQYFVFLVRRAVVEGWAGELRGALRLWFWLNSGGTLWTDTAPLKMPIVYRG